MIHLRGAAGFGPGMKRSTALASVALKWGKKLPAPNSHRVKRTLLHVLLACLAGPGATECVAELRSWAGSGFLIQEWSNPDNWDPHGVPQNGDELIFDNFTGGLMLNDLPDLTLQSLQFVSGSWQLSGNDFGVAGHIGNGGDGEVIIHCPTKLQGPAIYAAFSDLPSDSSVLRILAPINLNGRVLRLRARGDATLELGGAISGTGQITIDVVTYGYFRAGRVAFTGSEPNTFTGDVRMTSESHYLFGSVVGSNLLLDKDSAIAIPHSLIMGTNCEVKLNRPHQIADEAAVRLGPGATFLLQGNPETIGSLVLVGSWTGLDLGKAIVDTGGATLSVQGDIDSANFYADDIPIIRGKLGLPPGRHLINVSGDQFYGLQIAAQVVGDGGFEKTGPRGLIMSGNSSFNGEAVSSSGVLELRHANALGSVVGFTVLSNTGVLLLNGVEVYGESLFARGKVVFGPAAAGAWMEGVGTNLWSGPVILDTNLIVTGFNEGKVNFNGPISGPGGLRCLSGTVELSGTDANTFTGSTLVNNPLLLLNKSPNVRALGGGLIIGTGPESFCEARWLQNYQHLYGEVTVHTNGLVNLNNHYDDFGPINFYRGEIRTGSGELGLYGLVSVNCVSWTHNGGALILGRIGLPPGYHEFRINDLCSVQGLMVNATVVGAGHIRKTGPGPMWLNVPNTYSGLTVVDQGLLVANADNALGGYAAGTTVNEGATLGLVGRQVAEPMAIRGLGDTNWNWIEGDYASGALHVAYNAQLRSTFPSIYACLDLTTHATIYVAQGSVLTADGFISGAGNLEKTGAGTLVFTGAGGNTYSGNTLVNRGTLSLQKPAGVTAIPNHVFIGNGSGAATLLQQSSFSIIGSVTVGGDGLWDLTGFAEGFSSVNPPPISLNDGGYLDSGSSGIVYLPVGGNIVVNPGSHLAGSLIQGNIGLDPGPHQIIVAAGSNLGVLPGCDIAAAIGQTGSAASLQKTGPGTLRLSGVNTFTGATTVQEGTLRVDGSQPGSPVLVNAAARLQGSGTAGMVDFLSSGGIVGPGASPGVLSCGSFNGTQSGGILQMELNGAIPGVNGYDQLNVVGGVTLSGMTLSLTSNFAPQPHQQFVLINNDGADPVAGTFNGLPENANLWVGSQHFRISYAGGSGNDVVLTTVAPPPRLAIEKVSADSVRLLWPTNDPAFQLQFVTNILSTSWVAAWVAPEVIGTNFVVTNRLSQSPSALVPRAWYRLGENDPGAAPFFPVGFATMDFFGTNHLNRFGIGNPVYHDPQPSSASEHVASSLAVRINGPGEYFRSALPTTAMDHFGLELWVRPSGGSNARLAYNGLPGANGWGLEWQNGLFYVRCGGTTFAFASVPLGQWAHVAVVCENGLVTAYLNGVAVFWQVVSVSMPEGGFGVGSPEDFFFGDLDEVRVFTFPPGQFHPDGLLCNQVLSSSKLYRLKKP